MSTDADLLARLGSPPDAAAPMLGGLGSPIEDSSPDRCCYKNHGDAAADMRPENCSGTGRHATPSAAAYQQLSHLASPSAAYANLQVTPYTALCLPF
jgi:hypothetical protein